MGTHGGQPLKGVEDLFFVPALGFIDNLDRFRQIGHPLLGKSPPVIGTQAGQEGAYNIPGKVFSPRRRLYEPEAMASSSPGWILGPQKTD